MTILLRPGSKALKCLSVCLTVSLGFVWVEIDGHADVACVSLCACVCVCVCVCDFVRLFENAQQCLLFAQFYLNKVVWPQVYCALGPHLILWRGAEVSALMLNFTMFVISV